MGLANYAVHAVCSNASHGVALFVLLHELCYFGNPSHFLVYPLKSEYKSVIIGWQFEELLLYISNN
jgi:hypothetical protein